jgi:uncharacterized FlaG/YvyC family protein
MEITEVKKSSIDPATLREPVQTPRKVPERPSRELKNHAVAQLIETISKGDKEALQAVIDSINQFTETIRFTLKFIPNEKPGMAMIEVLDADGKVIRRIPPEALVELSSKIESSIGMFVNEILE